MRVNFRAMIFDAIITAFLFSVLLVVVYQPSDDDMLNLNRNAGLFLVGLVLGAILHFSLSLFKIQSGGIKLFGGSGIESPTTRSWYKTFWGWQIFFALLVSFAVAVVKTKFSFVELFDQGGFRGAVRLFTALTDPNWEVLPYAVNNIIETIFMAFLATTLAIPFAFVLSFLCAKNIMTGPFTRAVYWALRTILNTTRSIEALIWAIIFSIWVEAKTNKRPFRS